MLIVMYCMCAYMCLCCKLVSVWEFIHRSFDLMLVADLNIEFLMGAKTSICCIPTSVTEDA